MSGEASLLTVEKISPNVFFLANDNLKFIEFFIISFPFFRFHHVTVFDEAFCRHFKVF